MTLLIGFAIRSSVLLALGLLLSASLAKRSAALRHRVLAAALLGAALVLPFTLALPEWTVTLPAPVNDASAVLTSTVLPPAHSTPGAAGAIHLPLAGTSAAAPSARRSLSPILTVWLGGVLFALAILAAGLARVRGIAAQASRVQDQRWLDILDAVRVACGAGGYPHTSSATSTMSASFAHCSSSASSLPSTVEEKPH